MQLPLQLLKETSLNNSQQLIKWRLVNFIGRWYAKYLSIKA